MTTVTAWRVPLAGGERGIEQEFSTQAIKEVSIFMIPGVQNIPQTTAMHSFALPKAMPDPQPKSMYAEDVVRVATPQLMSDEESAMAMANVESSLQQNSAEALSIHSKLDLSRVLSLLDDVD